MTKQEITDKIIEIVCNKFMIDKEEITLKSTFKCHGIDSLYVSKTLAGVIIEIEEVFKINIPEKMAFRFYTISSVVDCVSSISGYVDMNLNKNKS